MEFPQQYEQRDQHDNRDAYPYVVSGSMGGWTFHFQITALPSAWIEWPIGAQTDGRVGRSQATVSMWEEYHVWD